MSNTGLNFRATVIAGVLSTLLAAVLTWLFGFWSAIWALTVSSAKWLWDTLWLTVHVPLGLIFIFFLASLVLVLRRKTDSSIQVTSGPVRYSSKAVPTGILGAVSSAAEPDVLSTKELTLLRTLAAADGREIAFDALAQNSHMSKLAAEQTVDHLISRGYLRDRRDILYGSMISLSPAGRDYVLSAGYAPN
jgi:hypothetical protein